MNQANEEGLVHAIMTSNSLVCFVCMPWRDSRRFGLQALIQPWSLCKCFFMAITEHGYNGAVERMYLLFVLSSPLVCNNLPAHEKRSKLCEGKSANGSLTRLVQASEVIQFGPLCSIPHKCTECIYWFLHTLVLHQQRSHLPRLYPCPIYNPPYIHVSFTLQNVTNKVASYDRIFGAHLSQRLCIAA